MRPSGRARSRRRWSSPSSSRRSSGCHCARGMSKRRKKNDATAGGARMIPARALLGAFIAFIAAAPFILPEFQVALLNYIGLATMVSLGLVLLTGVAGVMAFGPQAFARIAAYTTAVITTKYGGSPWLALAVGLALVAGVPRFSRAPTPPPVSAP